MDVAESMVFPSAAVPSTDSGKRVEYARLCALMVVCAGVVVSLGWQFRVPALRGALLGSFVAPNTALMAMLFGCAFLLLTEGFFLSPGTWRDAIQLQQSNGRAWYLKIEKF
jgi:hypothetical protein